MIKDQFPSNPYEHISLFKSENFLTEKNKIEGFGNVYSGNSYIPDENLPTLHVFIGPSGSGKTTITADLSKLMKSVGGIGYERIITATTRSPRLGEINGIDYEFLNNPQTLNEADNTYRDRIIKEAELDECDVHHGFAYGIPRKNLDKFFSNGRGYMILENAGAANIQKFLLGRANVPVIFVLPDNGEQLKESILSRENPELRTQRALSEIKNAYTISNFYIHNTRQVPLEDIQYETFRFVAGLL